MATLALLAGSVLEPSVRNQLAIPAFGGYFTQQASDLTQLSDFLTFLLGIPMAHFDSQESNLHLCSARALRAAIALESG